MFHSMWFHAFLAVSGLFCILYSIVIQRAIGGYNHCCPHQTMILMLHSADACNTFLHYEY